MCKRISNCSAFPWLRKKYKEVGSVSYLKLEDITPNRDLVNAITNDRTSEFYRRRYSK